MKMFSSISMESGEQDDDEGWLWGVRKLSIRQQ